jgi:Ni/Co efflux regulator RcnB
MQPSIRYLALLGLGLATMAVARPESAWRALQQGEDVTGKGMAPAQSPAQSQPQPPVPGPAQAPTTGPAPAPAHGPGQPSAPHYAPSGRPPPVFGVAQGYVPGAPRVNPLRGQQAPPQPNGMRPPSGFGGMYPGGNGAGNGGGNWRADDRRNDYRNNGQAEVQRNDYNNDAQGDVGQRNYNGDPGSAHRDRPTSPGRNYYNRPSYDGFRNHYYRYDGLHYYARTRYRLGAFYWPYGFGPQVWLIGDWLPPPFFHDDSYYLDNYWSYGLYQPPYGCRWMRVGNNAVLVDEFTGEILDSVYDLFW